MDDARVTASEAAVAGGRVLRERAGDLGSVRAKGWTTDFVTEADIASGVAVVRSILAADPAARVLVEEPEVCEQLGVAPATITEPEVWVIDPLDGTTSYVHGFPCFSVSVALVREGRPVAGAVLNAASGELFSAAQGTGAHLDDRPIQCSAAPTVRDALLVTGFPYDRGAPLDVQLAVLGAFLRSPAHGIRRDGSAAVDCCHVACGRADGFWEHSLKPWDMAAGVIICREAGAVVSDTTGAEWIATTEGICVANRELHPRMIEVIRTATPG